jgi:hypothetical protein
LLEKSGVRTKLVLIKGVIHGFFPRPGKINKDLSLHIHISGYLNLGTFPQACTEAMNAIQDFMKSI